MRRPINTTYSTRTLHTETLIILLQSIVRCRYLTADPEPDIAELRSIIARVQAPSSASAVNAAALEDGPLDAQQRCAKGDSEALKHMYVHLYGVVSAVVEALSKTAAFLRKMVPSVDIPKEEDVDFVRWLTISALFGALLGVLMFLYFAITKRL